MQNNNEKFIGSKIALIYENKIIAHLRNKNDSNFSDLWDLPGGTKENNENPFECLKRETFEEYGLILKETNMIWEKTYPDLLNSNKIINFFVSNITKEDVEKINFSDEGQRWELMDIEEFLKKQNAIKPFQQMVLDYLNR